MDPQLTRRKRLMRTIQRIRGLLVYYPLNDPTTAAINYAMANRGSFTATAGGDVTALGNFAKNGYGRGFTFGGTNGNLGLFSSNQFSISEGTMLVLVQTTATSGADDRDFVLNNSGGANNSGFGLVSVRSTTKASAFMRNSGNGLIEITSSSDVNDGSPHLLTVTCLPPDGALYFDGLSQTTTNTAHANTFSYGSGSARLGSDITASGTFYTGKLGHAAYFNRALSAAEVLKIARAFGLQ